MSGILSNQGCFHVVTKMPITSQLLHEGRMPALCSLEGRGGECQIEPSSSGSITGVPNHRVPDARLSFWHTMRPDLNVRARAVDSKQDL